MNIDYKCDIIDEQQKRGERNMQIPMVDKNEIKRYVAKWFAMSILTGRYSASPETKMDLDIRNINEKGVVTGVSAGTVKIFATIGEVVGEFEMTIEENPAVIVEGETKVYETKGDMVIHDGSGALIELNNMNGFDIHNPTT